VGFCSGFIKVGRGLWLRRAPGGTADGTDAARSCAVGKIDPQSCTASISWRHVHPDERCLRAQRWGQIIGIFFIKCGAVMYSYYNLSVKTREIIGDLE